MTAASAHEARQLCTFMVDKLFFGVDVTQVQEVLRHQKMTPVPLAAPVVRGLINLRGQIVTAIDLRRRLGMAPLPDGQLPTNVIIRHDDGAVSLLVDEIGDVVDVEDDLFEAPPETLPANAKALITGVYKLHPQLLLLLNTDLATRSESRPKEEGT